jgi:6-hydroxycyclohex-1-ene-1-carbonyl-CoA dehydrogenase
VRVPSRGLCLVPDLEDGTVNPHCLDLADLAVVAGAVSTPYQAILCSELSSGDLAVFVGVGRVGGFGVQIAKALDAVVVAVDVSGERLEKLRSYGASLILKSDGANDREIRRSVRAFAKERGIPSWRLRIFECSGTPEGETTAFGLLGPGAFLSIVGFTPEKVELHLASLMALDARAQGSWGCLPELYPPVLDLALSGRVDISHFVERRPLPTINDSFQDLRSRKISDAIILEPER